MQTTINYAGFWVRLMAFTLDLVALVALHYILFVGFLEKHISGLSSASISMLLIISYFIFPTLRYGQTLGKMVIGIKVVQTETGLQLSWENIVIREIVGKFSSAMLLFIGYLIVCVDAQKQGLHDKFGQSCVIWVDNDDI
ncbi:RDD family protein [Paenibacillus shunpengii]|uniref:RDD family protein n=1 Tax=Paenibacillus shunpengii TaxID=2054424 RepID=A0ABW5SW02_9BACL